VEKSKGIDLVFFSPLSPSFQYSVIPKFQLRVKSLCFRMISRVQEILSIEIGKLRIGERSWASPLRYVEPLKGFPHSLGRLLHALVFPERG